MFESHSDIEKMAAERSRDLQKENERRKQKQERHLWRILLTTLNLLLISGCTVTPLMVNNIDTTRLLDGVYTGHYDGGLNSASVEVSIQASEIIDIVILEHDALLGKKAESIIISEILEKQSTDVDSVSGATNSSHVIINAAQAALEKAYLK